MSILAAIALAASAAAPNAATADAPARTPVATSSARASVRVSRAERIDFNQPSQRNSERVQVRRNPQGRIAVDFR